MVSINGLNVNIILEIICFNFNWKGPTSITSNSLFHTYLSLPSKAAGSSNVAKLETHILSFFATSSNNVTFEPIGSNDFMSIGQPFFST